MDEPRLLIISGVRRGTVTPIPKTGEPVGIGRNRSNLVWVPDRLASGNHCNVRWEGDRAVLYDLDSLNGTYINTRFWAKKDPLVHSDRILGGTTEIIYLRHEDPLDAMEALSREIQDEETRLVEEETLSVSFAVRDPSAVYYQDVVQLLAKVSESQDAIDDRDAVPGHLLDAIFHGVPAMRGAILLNDGCCGPALSDFPKQFYRELDYDGPPRFSWDSLHHEAIEWVYRTRNGYLTNKPVSLLCYPLRSKGVILGILYLDNAQPQCRFIPQHLQIAGMAANTIVSTLGLQGRVETLSNRIQILEKSRPPMDSDILGNSPAIQAVREQIARVAKADVTVLIRGETGTGKELVAQAIHRQSRRCSNSFVAVNCGGFQQELVQSDLFGHVKGAYTGASTDEKGKLELADKGTIFLDEVGDLGSNMQTMLLRVLQSGEYYRLGSGKLHRCDIRVIAATNVNLEEAIQQSKFREDLYYRLNVYLIELPPLRERREDIPLLAQHFVKKHASPDRIITAIADDAMSLLMSLEWPGNIRQLESVIMAGLINGEGEVLLSEDIPLRIRNSRPAAARAMPGGHIRDAGRRAGEEAEIARAIESLNKNNGNKARTAKDLDISRNYLAKLLRRAEVGPESR